MEQSCVPKAQREATFTIAALHQWEMNVDDPRCVEAAESVRVPSCLCTALSDRYYAQWLSETIGSVALGGPFPSVRSIPLPSYGISI
jgi:hypothetical protein